jgi:hypothetical protein
MFFKSAVTQRVTGYVEVFAVIIGSRKEAQGQPSNMKEWNRGFSPEEVRRVTGLKALLHFNLFYLFECNLG